MQSKPLPYSPDAEQSLLGALLLNQDIIPQVKARLSDDDFYLEQHTLIYKTILEQKSSDITVIHDRIKDKVSREYLIELYEAVATSAAWEYHVEIIKRDSKKRKLWALGSQLKEDAGLPHSDLDSILSTVKTGLNAIEKDTYIEPENNEQLYYNTYKDIFEKKEPGIYTGIQGIDQRFYFEPGYIHLVAAESGVGKSAFLLQVSDYVSQTYGTVLFFSLESTRQKLAKRIICRHSMIALTRINKNHFTDDVQVQDIQDACSSLSGSKLVLLDDSKFTYIEHLISYLESYTLNNKVVMCCIDFLQMLDSLRQFTSDRSKVNYILSRIKSAAKDLNIPIVYVSQLRKDIEGEPTLDDLIESNYIRTHTDNILFLYAPDSKPVVYPVKCYLAKGKEQERFRQWLEFNGNYQMFTICNEPPLIQVKKPRSHKI